MFVLMYATGTLTFPHCGINKQFLFLVMFSLCHCLSVLQVPRFHPSRDADRDYVSL